MNQSPPWVVYERSEGKADILLQGRPGHVALDLPLDLATALVDCANHHTPMINGKRPQCACECGYRCGGPGTCDLEPMVCLQQEEGHYFHECGHKFDGPPIEEEDFSSLTCSLCGEWAMTHDQAVGP